MNIQIFSEWLRRQGHKVYVSPSSYWYTAGPRSLQAIPFHRVIEPQESELRRLILKNNFLSLRYSTPVNAPFGKASYHIEVRAPYTLEMLKSQARNGVKKGRCHFQIQQISFARLADEGWVVQQDTLNRQGRLSSMKEEVWRRLCLSAEGLAGFEAWGAVAGGQLMGALFTCQIDDVVCVPYALSRTSACRDHVNNVLFFDTCCNILARANVSKVFFTVQSLDAPESVDEFKLRMGFNPVPVRQRVVLHPLLTPLGISPFFDTLQWLMRRFPGNNFLAKTEGMVRFYRYGKRPLDQQSWPNCVAALKEQMLLSQN